MNEWLPLDIIMVSRQATRSQRFFIQKIRFLRFLGFNLQMPDTKITTDKHNEK